MTAPAEDTPSVPPASVLPHAGGDAPEPSDLARQVIELDLRRIAMDERRTEVVLLSVQGTQQADERRHASRMLALELRGKRDEARRGPERFVLRLVSIAFFLVTVVGLALLAAAFFGSDRQSSIALALLYGLLTALGGYGAVSGAIRGIKRLLDGRSGPDP